MRKRWGNIFLAAILFLTTGARWGVFQSIAWASMIVRYSERAPLAVALKETFDGKHPCCLCKAIAASHKSGKKTEYTLQFKQLEFPPVAENFLPAAPARFQFLPKANDTFAEFLTQKPLTPPPRAFFV